MSERETVSMLQRVPVILAVTAASYGLPLQAQAAAQRNAGQESISRPAATAGHDLQHRRSDRQR